MNIVIVEDHLMFRELVRKVCVHELGHTVVGDTASGAEAKTLISKRKPDVVIMDLALPDSDGFAVAEHALRKVPSVKILILSCHRDDYSLFRVEKLGVHGFIDKNTAAIHTLKEALMALAEGKTYYSACFRTAKDARLRDSRFFLKLLSKTEQNVLALIGDGLTDDEIARRLEIAVTTAQTHRRNISQKLDLQGTPKLVNFAITRGLTRPPQTNR